MKRNKPFLFIANILIWMTSSPSWAGLSIDSVSPNVGKIGEYVSVAIRGSGFDADTRVSMSVDTGNRSHIIGSIYTPGYANGVSVIDQTAYVADGSSDLQVIDVSDPQNPAIVGWYENSRGSAMGVAVIGQTAYVAYSDDGLHVIDVSDPKNPFNLGNVDTPGYASDVVVIGQTAYVADGDSGLQVIDVNNPPYLDIIGSVDTPGSAHGVAVSGQTAYVADSHSGLQVIDVSDPQKPAIVGSVDTPGSAIEVFIIDQTAYVADSYDGLQVIDVSDPQNPAIIGSVDTPDYANDIVVIDQTAYVADGDSGLQVIDVRDSANPAIIGSVDTLDEARGVSVIGQTAYVADNEAGLQVVDVSEPKNNAVFGMIDTPGWAEGIFLVDQTAYVADGSSGLQVIDVSDPQNPAIIGSADTPGSARGVFVIDQTAYVADGSYGLQVIDVSDPQNPAIVGSTNTPGLARGVFVIDQTAYVADGSYGLQIIDVSDRLDPYIVGSVDTPGEATGVSVIGQTAYVAALYAGLQVIDLSDPENPAIIGSLFEYAARGVFVIDRTAYVTSGGLDIIDVSDPQNPAITGSVDTPGFADEVVVIGQTAYVADYNSGLQAIDVSVAQNPVIIGSVDTFDTALSVAVTGNLAYVASGGRGLVIVPVPREIIPVQIIGPEEIRVTLPAQPILGNYNLRVFDRAQSDELVGAVTILPEEDLADLTIDSVNPKVGKIGENMSVEVRGSGFDADTRVTISLDTGDRNHIIGSLDTPGYASGVGVIGDTLYIADSEAGLQVIDVSDPQNPAIIGAKDTPGSAIGVAVIGQTAYVADGEAGLQVIDVSDPQNPAIVGSVDTPGSARGVVVIDQIAYVADGSSGLQVIDVNDPQNPAIVGSVDTPNWAIGVSVIGQTAYVADGLSGLQAIDVSVPQSPAIVGSVDTPGYADEVFAMDQTAYVADGLSGLQIIDVSDPQNPAIVGSANTPDYADDVVVTDQAAYVAVYDVGLRVIDVSDPQNPVIIGSADTEAAARSVALKGNAAYLASSDGGLVIVPVPREIIPVQTIGPEEIRMSLPDPTIAGNYNMRVFNQAESDELIGALTFLSEEDYQILFQKKAIIAVGNSGDASDRLLIPARSSANYAYFSLLSQGYTRENIQFLAPHVDWDVDGDGSLNDVDDICTSATLFSAITEWGADASELLVFLVGHGGVGTFLSNDNDIVHASELGQWLNTAQNTIPGKTVLIYDACFSGSFLAETKPPPGKERIVVTSSLADEVAWFLNEGALSFGYQFWASVIVNANMYESFLVAQKMMAHGQTAVMDADGDGVQTKEDVIMARDFRIGRGGIAASTPPEIGEVSGEQVLFGTSSANLWASNIESLNEIERVWAVIVPPDFDNSTGTEVVDMDTVELIDPDQDGVYTGAYDQFVQPGTYDVFVYASDNSQTLSLPRATTVVIDPPGLEGTVYIDSSGDCGDGNSPCYDTFQQGLSETGKSSFRLKISQGDYYEDVTTANDFHYTLSGGYDGEYAAQNGLSAIIGSLAITTGTLELENISIAGQ